MGLSADEWKRQALDLARRREAAGRSQTDVARQAGVSPRYICQIENGETQPSEKALRAYAAICRFDADRLLLSWHRTPSDLTEKLRANPHLCAVLRAFPVK